MNQTTISPPPMAGKYQIASDDYRIFLLHVEDEFKLTALSELGEDGVWRDVETDTGEGVDWWEQWSSQLLFEFECDA